MKKRFEKRMEFSSRQSEEIYSLISKIDAVRGQWRIEETLSPQTVAQLRVSALVTSSGASTRIEGSRLTNDEVRALFEKRSIRTLRTRDEQEVVGYLELLRKVFDSYETLVFSESLIKHFHGELLKYAEKDQRHRGSYKFGPNRVEAKDENGNIIGIIFDPTPPHLTSKEMRELTEWTEDALTSGSKHPLIVVANFLFEFLAIHPFQDGNGRLSRILTNLLLLRSGYRFMPYVSHESLIEESKAEYYLALHASQNTWKTEHEDIIPWIWYFLSVMERQSSAALDLLSRDNVEKFLSEKQTLVWQYALSRDSFQRSDAISATGLKPRTVEESIKKLVRMNKLEKIGEGRATRYRKV
jgi:Fic family protein